MKIEDVLGAYELLQFTTEGADGVAKPWGRDLRGLLIYEAGGSMSVSIQRAVPDPKPQDWEPLDDFLFYAGTFHVTAEGTVEHHVRIATDRDRVGQVLIRRAMLTGDVLNLSAQAGSDGTTRITWRRL